MSLFSLNKSVSKKTSFQLSIALTIILGIALAFFLLFIESKIMQNKKIALQELGATMVESISFAMSEGSTDVTPYVEQVSKQENLAELRIIPSNFVYENNESKMDEIEKKVNLSGEPIYLSEDFNNMEVFRSVIPIKANATCIGCHDGNIGNVMATMSIRYSMEETYANIYTERIIGIIIILVALATVIVLIPVLLKRIVLKDLFSSISFIKNLSQGNIKRNLEINREDEIGELEDSLNMLKDNRAKQAEIVYQMSKGNFNLDVNIISEEDVLGKALNEIKLSLINLSTDTRKLAEAAHNGDLNIKADEQKHEGDFREIVKGFNNTFTYLTEPIDEGCGVMFKMAEGDLTARMKGHYLGDHQTIKKSINNLADSFSEIITDVNNAVNLTRQASQQISASTEEMAAGATEQSSQSEDVASAVEEMTKTILETAENSTTAAKLSKDAGDEAKRGAGSVENSISGMKSIVKSTDSTGKVIESLAAKTDEIGKITQVIDDIADQTNLLALNAAIEAARAGEQGRGFAVVADEVRKLAERTTKATKEITETIKAIQSEAKEADSSMKEANDSVNKGMHLSEEVETVLQNIIIKSDAVIAQIEQVATASEEQSSTAELISKNIESINNVTNESAAGIQQIAKSSEELNSLTENLYKLVNKFKINSNIISGSMVRENGKLISS
ncbi:MAG: methyl-accepting chemotaxis protein [Ignavibacteria bacterium]|jgi:methyl-accepting chemotaxis protein